MSPHFNDFQPERIDVSDVAALVLSSEDEDKGADRPND